MSPGSAADRRGSPACAAVRKARALGERRIVVVEDAGDVGPVGKRLAHDHVGLADLRRAVVAPAVGLEAAEAAHEPRAAVAVAVDAELLAVVAVAADLQIGADRQPPRRVDLGEQADHPTRRVAVEHGARTADHLDAPHRPQIDVTRLGGPVRSRDGDAVLNDGQSAQAEARLRRANAQPDAAGQPVAAAVLDEQPGDAPQRLVERRLPLREVERLGPHHRHRVGHRRQALIRTGHGDRLGQRRDGQREIQGPGNTAADRHRRRLAEKTGELSLDLVVAGGQTFDLVAAAGVGDGAARQTARRVANRHGHPRQDAAELVQHGTGDRTGTALPRRCRHACRTEAERSDEGAQNEAAGVEPSHRKHAFSRCRSASGNDSRALANSTDRQACSLPRVGFRSTRQTLNRGTPTTPTHRHRKRFPKHRQAVRWSRFFGSTG